eukprot:TRINITY_DN519_c0_g1_i1.p1 TRINITY_DN519_c0_g1~~TRINITY_DN519_c0_g1_i1.p1  ORF type:complete len:179 (-),score=18.49 TRINITY_DN519_c0_g1_i1:138-674(-)
MHIDKGSLQSNKENVNASKAKGQVEILRDRISLKKLGKMHRGIEEIIKSDTYRLIMQDARKRRKERKVLEIQQRAGTNILLWYIQRQIQVNAKALLYSVWSSKHETICEEEQTPMMQRTSLEVPNARSMEEVKKVQATTNNKLNKTFLPHVPSKKIKAIPGYLRPTKTFKHKLNASYC